MPPAPDENHLADRHYYTVVMRMVVDRRGRLLHGELVGNMTMPPDRFVGWRGLIRVMRAWLIRQEHDAHDR